MNKQIKNIRKTTNDAINDLIAKQQKELLDKYVQTVDTIKKEMQPLFETGIDEKRHICNTSIPMESIDDSYDIFEKSIIEEFKDYLDNAQDNLDGTKKTFLHFVNAKEERFSLCFHYENLGLLNSLEIAYVEFYEYCNSLPVIEE